MMSVSGSEAIGSATKPNSITDQNPMARHCPDQVRGRVFGIRASESVVGWSPAKIASVIAGARNA